MYTPYEREPKRPRNKFTDALTHLLRESPWVDDRFDDMRAAKQLREYTRNPNTQTFNELYDLVTFADNDIRQSIHAITAYYDKDEDRELLEADYTEAVEEIITDIDSYDLAHIARTIHLALKTSDWQFVHAVETLNTKLTDSYGHLPEDVRQQIYGFHDAQAAIHLYMFAYMNAREGAMSHAGGSDSLHLEDSTELERYDASFDSSLDEREDEETPNTNISLALELLLDRRSCNVEEDVDDTIAERLYKLTADPADDTLADAILEEILSDTDDVKVHIDIAVSDIQSKDSDTARSDYIASLASFIENRNDDFSTLLTLNAVKLAKKLKAWELTDSVDELLTNIEPLLANDEEGKVFLLLVEAATQFKADMEYDRLRVFRDFINSLD
jgi:hypothetical protein